MGGIAQELQFSKYHIPTDLDVPDIETTFIEAELSDGPFDAKNLAEPGMVGTTPAIANAIYDATGVRCYQIPIQADWLKSQLDAD